MSYILTKDSLSLPPPTSQDGWKDRNNIVRHIREDHLDCQLKIVYLMVAQFLVFCGTLMVQPPPDDSDCRSFGLVAVSKVVSLAGLLVQMACYHTMPSEPPPEAFTVNDRSRVVYYTLWSVQLAPLLFSVLLLGTAYHMRLSCGHL